MACPLVNEVVEVEAQFIQRLLCKEKVIRACLDVSLEECLYERYCLTSHSIIYLTICSTHIYHILHILDLHYHHSTFYASSFDSFLYNIRDTEHIRETAVCWPVTKVSLKRLWTLVVVWPGHKSQSIIRGALGKSPNVAECR